MLEHKFIKKQLIDQYLPLFNGSGIRKVTLYFINKSHQKCHVGLDASEQFIKAIDFGLNYLYFKEQIVKAIKNNFAN